MHAVQCSAVKRSGERRIEKESSVSYGQAIVSKSILKTVYQQSMVEADKGLRTRMAMPCRILKISAVDHQSIHFGESFQKNITVFEALFKSTPSPT